jgi:hypothetical protein
MIIVFPSSSDSQFLPDSKFLKESVACEELGIDSTTVNIRALMAGDRERMFRFAAQREHERGIYRGGTLKPHEYEQLHSGLAARGIHLLTSPTQYAAAQLFSHFYPHIADLSFPAITTTSLEPATVQSLASQLGSPPYFIKDYIKSAKEIWPQGCVIPVPGTVDQFATTIRELREFRGDRFTAGLVVRPLLKFRSLGVDPFGDECLEEYRMVFLHGRRAFTFPYGYHAGSFTNFTRCDILGERIDSPFFMADCAVTESGECYLLELGDGGCCGLPPRLDCRTFYQALIAKFARSFSARSDPESNK